jgi:magnesium chelatase family protein
LYVDVDEVKHRSLLRGQSEEPSKDIQKRVVQARDCQLNRYKNPLKHNADLGNREIKKYISLSEAAEELLNQAAEQLNISARSYMRILKVAQTIADLDAVKTVEVPHITEALQYRRHVTQYANA